MHTPGITILHPRFWTLGTVFGTLYPGLWRLGWGVGVIDTYAGCCRWGGVANLVTNSVTNSVAHSTAHSTAHSLTKNYPSKLPQITDRYGPTVFHPPPVGGWESVLQNLRPKYKIHPPNSPSKIGSGNKIHPVRGTPQINPHSLPNLPPIATPGGHRVPRP